MNARSVRYFLPCILAVAWLAAAPNRLSAQNVLSQQDQSFRARIFVFPAESAARFDTDLFSIDPSIKQHPHNLTGTGFSLTLGAPLGKTWALFVRGYDNRLSGNGNWLDTDGMDAEEAAFLPVATGRTAMRIRGLTGGIEKDFHIGGFHPFFEASSGAGIMKINFNGTVNATDPTDGEQFTVAAQDKVHRLIPVGALGGGMDIPTPFGITFRGGYRWSEGSLVYFGIKCFPFGIRSSR